MPSYIYDVIIIAILALFVWRGASRGLILTLCGLAAAFVAFFGARFVSSMFCQRHHGGPARLRPERPG